MSIKDKGKASGNRFLHLVAGEQHCHGDESPNNFPYRSMI